jgi:hypothetical protein
MQAQEYAMAKWAIGLRLPGTVDADIEKAFNKGDILRTHLMRPTWHFVAPADIRWLLALTAPRVHAVNAFMYRQLELDNKLFKRCNDILIKSLEGNNYLTRDELRDIFTRNKINAESFRLAYLLMNAELEALICSGPRKANQFTLALLEERVKPVKAISKDEALAQFTQRYFKSRGPATLKDFTTWSGLTVSEAKAGIAMLPKKFVKEKMGEQEYIYLPNALKNNGVVQDSFLMPDYDEYGMSYKDRSALMVSPIDSSFFRGENPAYNRMIIINGKIVGTWKRVIKNHTVNVDTVLFRPLTKSQQMLLNKAVNKYCTFIGKEEHG